VTGIAVVDVETTGFYRTDRIVEVGIVLLDGQLRVEHEWGTLINPHRDLSATEVHGISASDVAEAPDFDTVAAHLAALLDCRVVVAHNAGFDLRMLAGAFAPTDALGPDRLVVVDTLRMARDALGGPASLAVIADYLSIDQPAAHEALADARVTAEVLSRLIEQGDGIVPTGAAVRAFSPDGIDPVDVLDGRALDELLAQAQCTSWRGAEWLDPAPVHTRTHAATARVDRDRYLARLVAELPAEAGLTDAALDPYLLMLEQALLDRLVTRDEAEALARLARELGLTGTRVRAAHLSFLAALARAAWADEVVTTAERADLDRVAGLLDLAPGDVDAALDEAKRIGGAPPERRVGALVLAPGDRVVFTGAASVPRDMLTSKATAAGLAPTSAVSKRTAAVVMADPLSESTKARKARELGIPVVSEQVFLALLEDLGQASV
jgi:DNA polymerase-3 subunit epsilon